MICVVNFAIIFLKCLRYLNLHKKYTVISTNRSLTSGSHFYYQVCRLLLSLYHIHKANLNHSLMVLVIKSMVLYPFNRPFHLQAVALIRGIKHKMLIDVTIKYTSTTARSRRTSGTAVEC